MTLFFFAPTPIPMLHAFDMGVYGFVCAVGIAPSLMVFQLRHITIANHITPWCDSVLGVPPLPCF